VVTRSLIAKRAVDDNEIWSLPGWSNLARRRDAHQQLQPQANNSSAIRTANGAPTAQPTIQLFVRQA
jgi:hypothetical protein